MRIHKHKKKLTQAQFLAFVKKYGKIRITVRYARQSKINRYRLLQKGERCTYQMAGSSYNYFSCFDVFYRFRGAKETIRRMYLYDKENDLIISAVSISPNCKRYKTIWSEKV